MVMPGRSYTAGSGYRYGFNGQEKSDEIAEGVTTAQFWEYDSRIGRRWNVDPEAKVNFSKSPYSVLSNNPIIFMDPKGDLDFFNTNGDWVGQDNKDDKKRMIVTDKEIAKEIKKITETGMDYKPEVPMKSGFVLPSTLATKEMVRVLDHTKLPGDGIVNDPNRDKTGGRHEEASTVYKNGAVTRILSGPVSHPEQEDHTTAEVVIDKSKEAEIFIHSHPTAVVVMKNGVITNYYSNNALKPSSFDLEIFKNFELNAIVGKAGKFDVSQNDGSDDDNRENVFALFDSKGNLIGVASIEALKKIDSGKRGKLGEKHKKEKEKKEKQKPSNP